jgi:hypothetical protein
MRAVLLALCACAGTTTPVGGVTPATHLTHFTAVRDGSSLGPVLTTSDGGQIFGVDIDQNGSDGVLASASNAQISVQTFDETTGKITGKKVVKGDDYVADGIFAGDVGLVDFQKAGKPGQTPTKDMYHLLNPVTQNRVNGKWIPPLKLFNVFEWAPNQNTDTSVVFGYQREGSDPLDLIVSDVSKNTFGKVIGLSEADFALGTQPQLAEDTVNNPRGDGIACTTTELDAGVEFYNVAKQTGIRVQLPKRALQERLIPGQTIEDALEARPLPDHGSRYTAF